MLTINITMEKLDKNDYKLIRFLDQSARTTLTTIAAKLKASPQVVKYHFDKLVESGTIIGFWPAVDFRKIGYLNVSYFFKLKNVSNEAKSDLFDYIKSCNDINISMQGDGFWDLHITFSTLGIFANQTAFEVFYERFHNLIADYKTAIPVGFYQFPRKYLNENPESSTIGVTGSNVSSIEMTEVQKNILELINENARISYNEISDRIAISRQTAVKNVESLEKKGVIQRYTILLDHKKMGLYFYRTLIQIKNFNPERQKELFSFCEKNPNIVNFLKLVGNWQLLIDVEVPTVEGMRNLSQELREKFGDLIEYVEPTLVYEISKFRDIPKKLSHKEVHN